MSYLNYYNLKREPFSNAPDRRFFYRNEAHERALLRLEHVAHHQRGLALCTGPIGHGKTTLARRFYDILPDEEYHKALLVVIHSDITTEWLLHKFARMMGIRQPKTTKVEILGQIYQRLRQIDDAGKKAVIMIDEAQMFKNRDLMEEFRGLLNIELKGRKLLTFIFFGLPEIEDSLRLDEPLRQRVALRVTLESYSEEQTRSYIHHRMQVAGGTGHVFGPEIVSRLHRYCKGTPRLINTLCDNLLLEGFLNRKPIIQIEMVDELAASFHLAEPEPEPVREPKKEEGPFSIEQEVEQNLAEALNPRLFDTSDDPIDELLALLDK